MCNFKNNQTEIYIYSKDLPVLVYINEKNTIIWIFTDIYTGEQTLFNKYSVAK